MFVQTLKLILYINVWFIHILRRQTAFLFHTDTIIERSYLRRDIVGTERELYTRGFRFLNDRFIRNMIKLVYLQSLSTFAKAFTKRSIRSSVQNISYRSLIASGRKQEFTYISTGSSKTEQIRSNIISIYACSSSIITSLFTHRCVRRPL